MRDPKAHVRPRPRRSDGRPMRRPVRGQPAADADEEANARGEGRPRRHGAKGIVARDDSGE